MRVVVLSLLLTGCFDFTDETRVREMHMNVDAEGCTKVEVSCGGIRTVDDTGTTLHR